jgi:hypothetical protein
LRESGWFALPGYPKSTEAVLNFGGVYPSQICET